MTPTPTPAKEKCETFDPAAAAVDALESWIRDGLSVPECVDLSGLLELVLEGAPA